MQKLQTELRKNGFTYTQLFRTEKKAMYKIWASREKQIWVVQENISALFGSIKGIAGKEFRSGRLRNPVARAVTRSAAAIGCN